GCGLFRWPYQPGPAPWAMLPATLEWHAAAALIALAALVWPPAWLAVAAMLGLSVGVAVLQAAQARLAPGHAGLRSRCVVAALCYLQPLVRSWVRYRTRLFSYRPPRADPQHLEGRRERLPLRGRLAVAYWTEQGYERTELLGLVIAYLNERGWGKVIDSGWADWDLRIYCHPWTAVEVCTAQQDYGGRKRLICVRYRLRPSGYLHVLGVLALLAAAAGLLFWPAAGVAAALLLFCGGLWWLGAWRASQAVAVVDFLASSLGLVRCAPPPLVPEEAA